MKDVVDALIAVTPRIFAVSCLLILIFYIYAVLLTSSFKTMYDDGYLTEDFFGRIDQTFFTLFQILTMDSWSDITKQVQAVYAWGWIPFVTFQLISSFVVINLVIAVICDAVADLQNKENQEQVKRVETAVTENNEVTVRHLEKKIDEMSLLIEKLLEQQGLEIEKSKQS